MGFVFGSFVIAAAGLAIYIVSMERVPSFASGIIDRHDALLERKFPNLCAKKWN